MTDLMKKPFSWISFLGTVTLLAGISLVPACGGDDDDTTPPTGDDDDTTPPTGDDDDTTPPTGDDDDSQSPSPIPEVTVSFQVILVDPDGNSLLDTNAVGESDDVYVVGSFTSWCPNFDGYQMGNAGDEDPATYELSITFPHDGFEWSDPCGQAPKTFIPGDTLEFKFAKTTSDEANGWAEGQKDLILISEKACGNQNEPDATWGLWEVPNNQFVIPTAAEAEGEVVVAGPYEVEAWRNTADALPGITQCD